MQSQLVESLPFSIEPSASADHKSEKVADGRAGLERRENTGPGPASESASSPPVLKGADASALWKLNVSAQHVKACLEHKAFGVSRPVGIEHGDVLLLQITKVTSPDLHARVPAALVVDRVVEDSGQSERYWGVKYPWLVEASEVIRFEPFSLEDLPGITGNYSVQGKMGHERILDDDRDLVLRAMSRRLEP